MADDLGGDVEATYRYLRGAIVLLLVMLLVSVVVQTVVSGCLLGSISSYYFTPVRAVFIGSLFALGAALVAYQGSTPEEDTLLNFSGLMAFVVAMVPTVPDSGCPSEELESAPPGFAMTDAEIAKAVTNNIWSLILVTVFAVATVLIIRTRTYPGVGIVRVLFAHIEDGGARHRTIWITSVCGLIVAGELVAFLALPDDFIRFSHGLAASTMVLGVIAVMLLNLKSVGTRHSANGLAAYKRWYRSLAIVLAGALAGATAASWLLDRLDHLILFAEVIVLLDFVAYWSVQTVEFSRPAPTVVEPAA